MRREEGTQLLFSPQFAHDLRERQFGKNPIGLQPQRQQISEHFDEQGRIQTIAWQLHRANMENRFHDLPETFNDMVLFPHVPDFRTPQRDLTKIHQIVAASGTYLKEKKNQ